MPEQPAARIHSDVPVGVVLLAFAALTYWLTTSFRSVPAMLSQNIPPTFFPRLVIGLIALLSLGLIARGVGRTPSRKTPIGRKVLETAALIVLTPLAITIVGTWPTIVLVSFVLPALWHERRWRLMALLAVVLPAFIYGLFGLALGLRFPAGLIAGILS
jgi:hypothetical protein